MLMLNYFSYLVIGWIWMFFHAMLHKYDVVFCQQLSPVTMSSPAVLYKKMRYKNSDRILTSSRNFDKSILKYGAL